MHFSNIDFVVGNNWMKLLFMFHVKTLELRQDKNLDTCQSIQENLNNYLKSTFVSVLSDVLHSNPNC